MKDKKLEIIKAVVRNYFPECKIILFGSRSKNDYEVQSDYDILVITDRSLEIREKRHYASVIRKELASMLIDVDILIKTEDDVNYYRDKIGSVTREALRKGILLT